MKNPTDKTHPASPLGAHLGSRDPAHIARWVRAGSTAAATGAKRRCEGINRNPPFSRCKKSALRHGTRCSLHTPLREHVAIDDRRRPELLKIVETTRWAPARLAAEAALRAIERRALRFRWLFVDPREPGSLVSFSRDADRHLCEDWLRSIGYDIGKPSPLSGELPSARCIDRCLWAAARFIIKGNITEAKALASVKKAHRDDGRFFERLRIGENAQ